MAASFHFLFELVKIALLAAAYSAILSLVFDILSEALKFKKISFFTILRIVAIMLFVFMFTYYGNHGLGDESRIPIGNGEKVTAIDSYSYFKPSNGADALRLSAYAIKNNVLYADTEDGFMVYNLESKHIDKFDSSISYNAFAAKNNMPVSSEFESFEKHYHEYWNGWRFWILP